MDGVWAHKPCVANAGPRSKDRNIGFEAVSKYWQDAFDFFSRIKAEPVDTRVQVNGNLAWVVGKETAELQPKSSAEALKFETLVTHIREGEWAIAARITSRPHHSEVRRSLSLPALSHAFRGCH